MVFLEAAACLRRRREAGETAVAGETARLRLVEGRFRVASSGAAAATFLVVSRRRFHIGGAWPRAAGGAAAAAAASRSQRGGGAPARRACACEPSGFFAGRCCGWTGPKPTLNTPRDNRARVLSREKKMSSSKEE